MFTILLWVIGAFVGWGYLLKVPRHLAEVREIKRHWEEAKREKPALVESTEFAYRNTRMANYCGIAMFGVIAVYCSVNLIKILIPQLVCL